MDELERWYRTLDLEPGASPEGVKRAWRDLTKVWHAGRFQGDPRMEAKGEEKRKAINFAYQQLTDVTARGRATPQQPTTASPKSTAQSAGDPGEDRRPSAGTTAPADPRARATRRFDEEPNTLNYFVLLRRCLKAAGRFSRAEFAVVFLGTIFGVVAVAFGLALTLGAAGFSESHTSAAVGVLSLATMPLMLVATIGGGIRRWHDLGKSGWYVLLVFLPVGNLLVILYLLLAAGDAKGEGRTDATPRLVVLWRE